MLKNYIFRQLHSVIVIVAFRQVIDNLLPTLIHTNQLSLRTQTQISNAAATPSVWLTTAPGLCTTYHVSCA